MRIATWNVNSLGVRLGHVEEWLSYASPDVLCLQETKLSDGAFPHERFAALGYESAHNGPGRWNGVAILSKVGLDQARSDFSEPSPELAEGRFLIARCGPMDVVSVYVPNGRSLESEHYEIKLGWLRALGREVAAQRAAGSAPLAVCGDFNVAPEDKDVWDPAQLVGSTHVSVPEREALESIVSLGMVDAFRQLHPEDRLYSWWDYRAGRFHKHEGMRIDLVLLSTDVADKAGFALIDRFARRQKQPSDHAPVLVDVEL